jgi:hypothetical protein
MTDANEFPFEENTILSSLIELLRHQNDVAMVQLLTKASCRIECHQVENFNHVIDVYTIFIEIPIEQYAPIEEKTENIERKLYQKVKSLIAPTNGFSISALHVRPRLVGDIRQTKVITNLESSRIWDEGCLRVFLSHVSAHKKKVVELKSQLRDFHVSAFVAHEDIEPSRKWQKEIELALNSMDAFIPLLTEDFHNSNWTDQELGIALGLDAVIIPVRLGRDPYGFIGENQGLSGDLKKTKELASGIIDALLLNTRLGSLMRDVLVNGLEKSESFIDSIQICERLNEVNGFTDEQIKRLQAALKNNDQVYNAFKVPGWINGIVKKHKKNVAN